MTKFQTMTSAFALTLSLTHAPSLAQDSEPATTAQAEPDVEVDEDNLIVVTGQRLRDQAISSQPPIASFDEYDIKAVGTGSIEELLTALGSQVSTGRGRGGERPVILVNGRRISSFRELRSYPPEAVQRVDVLPEEVALNYGYGADQRVVNFILKDNFESREVEVEYAQAGAGGYGQSEVELTYLKIDGADRLNFNLKLNDATALTEAERGLFIIDPVLPGDPEPAQFRTLLPDTADIEATANWSRGLGEQGTGGSISVNGAFERSDSLSLDGLNTATLVAADGSSALRAFPDAITAETRTDTYSLGSTLDLPLDDWRFTATIDANRAQTDTQIARNGDTDGAITAALAGDIAIDGPLPALADAGFDFAQSTTTEFSGLTTLSGRPFLLPGGEVTLTVDSGFDWQRIDSTDTTNPGVETQLTRGDLSTGVNLGIPIASRRDEFLAFLGDVDLNIGGGGNYLSDFGTVFDADVGLTWKPTDTLTLQSSYLFREVAPTLANLSNPTIVSPNNLIYDFATGDTVLVDLTTGGNPALLTETQSDWKYSINWDLPQIADNIREASIRLEYFDNHSSDVTSSFPSLTAAVEDAFGERVTRSADGTLIALDQRSVTFAEVSARRLKASLNLGGMIGQEPERTERRDGPPSLPGGNGRDRQGRWRMSLDYGYELSNEVQIADDGIVLDQLAGDALTATGVPRHTIGFRTFAFYQGLGGRLSYDWQSGTRVNGSADSDSSDLTFGSIGTFDLGLFADMETLFDGESWLDGTRVSFGVVNIFNERQSVTDADGVTPIRYLPAFLDPAGRTFEVEFRKLF